MNIKLTVVFILIIAAINFSANADDGSDKSLQALAAVRGRFSTTQPSASDEFTVLTQWGSESGRFFMVARHDKAGIRALCCNPSGRPFWYYNNGMLIGLDDKPHGGFLLMPKPDLTVSFESLGGVISWAVQIGGTSHSPGSNITWDPWSCLRETWIGAELVQEESRSFFITRERSLIACALDQPDAVDSEKIFSIYYRKDGSFLNSIGLAGPLPAGTDFLEVSEQQLRDLNLPVETIEASNVSKTQRLASPSQDFWDNPETVRAAVALESLVHGRKWAAKWAELADVRSISSAAALAKQVTSDVEVRKQIDQILKVQMGRISTCLNRFRTDTGVQETEDDDLLSAAIRASNINDNLRSILSAAEYTAFAKRYLTVLSSSYNNLAIQNALSISLKQSIALRLTDVQEAAVADASITALFKYQSVNCMSQLGMLDAGALEKCDDAIASEQIASIRHVLTESQFNDLAKLINPG